MMQMFETTLSNKPLDRLDCTHLIQRHSYLVSHLLTAQIRFLVSKEVITTIHHKFCCDQKSALFSNVVF